MKMCLFWLKDEKDNAIPCFDVHTELMPKFLIYDFKKEEFKYVSSKNYRPIANSFEEAIHRGLA